MFRKKWLRLFDLIFPRIIFVNQILKANNLHNFEYFQKALKCFTTSKTSRGR